MPETTISFRIATAHDIPTLKQVIESAFRAEDPREDWVGIQALASSFTVDEKYISSVISHADSVFLIAHDKANTVLGTIGAAKRESGTARLFMLAVDPQIHRGGIGRQILSFAEDYCQREWDTRVMSLDALSTRPSLVSWYMRRGYQKTGKTELFPRELANGLELPEDLHFVDLEKRV
ncbi:hypothetical protein POX_b02011 [Penicillium oxalicum]|uniref:hypothetical protein n=1 Tax=Penicillium oxalicum TaxID=69781 RepID=UPI0020B8757B|nr:hypothetical protein POX_b02011 [Penicillium oxalicum]KAI2791982.1 hypothetical protein POX_b02011 [Penicillium oxalicum]